MKKKEYLSDDVWLYLLKEAFDRGVKVAMTHGFTYKGYKLGSFLVNAKLRKNQETAKKVEEIGFIYKYHNKKNPNDYLESFILKLKNDPNPRKGHYITLFNTRLFPKNKFLKKELKKELNKVWKEKFGDKRVWKKPTTLKQRVKKWKEYRYDTTINPRGRWTPNQNKQSQLYYWTYTRKVKKDRMEELVKYFNKQELLELKNENFLVDSKYLEKPKYKRITKEEKKKKYYHDNKLF